MHLNGIPTNQFAKHVPEPQQEVETFTAPQTTIEGDVGMVDDGVIYLNQVLPVDPTYTDPTETLTCGKPRPPHDLGDDVVTEATPLNQWLLDGSSKRSHIHWRQAYQYYLRNRPTPVELNGRDLILKQHNALEVLKSAGSLPKREGPIIEVLDSMRRWEDQFLQVVRGLIVACSIYGKLLLNGVHSTWARLNKKKFAIEQIETNTRVLP